MMDLQPRTYSAYGAHEATTGAARTAFAGERCETGIGWYLLGERPYSPMLRRFLAPDRLSPFASGGINRYAYCSGDPINRIDPSGNTPLPWMGIFSRLKHDARLKDAGGSAATASGSIDAATTTPGTLASGVASVTNTVSVTSAIVPTSMTTGPAKALGLHGRAGSTSASGGAGLPPPRRRKSTQDTVIEIENSVPYRPNVIAHNGIDVHINSSVPYSRIGARQDGSPYVLPRWSEHIHPTNPNSMILASDAITYALEYDALFSRLRELGVRSFTHYTGSHGNEYGLNWYTQSLRNLAPDRAMFQRDAIYMQQAAVRFGMAIGVVDIGGWTSEQFRVAISRDGVHALNNCFGIADPVIRREFNLPSVSVYHLPSRP